MLKLIQKIKKAPKTPGVYLFKDKNKRPIYIGRSINLKKRLENYFRSKQVKSIALIQEAKEISFKKTKNLLEAIILEINLIKQYQPKYNIREKDDRSFIYIVIPQKAWTYPLLLRYSEIKKYLPNKAEIFGPFQSLTLARNLLRLLRRVFPYSTCQFNAGKPCFDFQIGLCAGKCLGIIKLKDYQKNIEYLILFLKGEKTKLKKLLKIEAPEKISFLRDINDSILITSEEQKELPSFNHQRIEGYDISHFSGRETFGAMVVFENNNFAKNQYRLFKIKTAKANDDLSALAEMLERRLNHPEWPLPNLILVDGGRSQVNVLEKILLKRKINIPVVGIAKHKTEKLIFNKIKKSLREIISLCFNEFKKIRDEAHRFANFGRKRLSKHYLKILMASSNCSSISSVFGSS